MKIKSIHIKNYRLLKDFKLDLEDELSLVLGKNNTGKTSILSVLEKFINSSDKSKFTPDDFNLEFKNQLMGLIENSIEKTEEEFEDIGNSIGIKLRLVLEYYDNDDLSNISNVMMNLDPDNNFVVLGFDFVINHDRYKKFRKDYYEFRLNEKLKFEKGKVKPTENQEQIEQSQEDVEIKSTYTERDFNYFFKQNFTDYFKLFKSPLEWDNVNNCIIESTVIGNENFKDIINFKSIKAKRDVTNTEADKALSKQTSKIYQKEETSEEQKEKIEKFTDELSNTDDTLTEIYADIFKGVIEDIKSFGGLKRMKHKSKLFQHYSKENYLKVIQQ